MSDIDYKSDNDKSIDSLDNDDEEIENNDLDPTIGKKQDLHYLQLQNSLLKPAIPNDDDDDEDDDLDDDDLEDDIEGNEDDDDDEEEDDLDSSSLKKTLLQPIKSDDDLGDDDDDDEDDNDDDENYLQKLEGNKNDFIQEYHTQSKMVNYDEIKHYANITRNSEGIIIDELHRTLPFLTKFEYTKIIGQRAKQIDSGAEPFISVPKDIITGYDIAILELKEKKIPFIIKRPLPGGGFEYWRIHDLEMII